MPYAGLVGRSVERSLIADTISAADAGSPGMLLLHGEPGIGKTRLVAETVEGLLAGSHQVLWAQCLRLRSDAGSFLPFSGRCRVGCTSAVSTRETGSLGGPRS
jgi:predicted ATPase